MHRSSRSVALAAALALSTAVAACGSDDASTATFTAPTDGSHVAGGVDVELVADGITIEEAGTVRAGAGHFHVLADAGCAATGDAIPKDADHVHLGKGQSDATIYLAPGRHELCVQVGDGEHHALAVHDTITVDVGVADLDEWCAVVGEVDGLFELTDNSSADLAVRQVGYESTRRLLEQAREAIDLVDADQRAAVAAALGGATTVAEVLSTTDDAAEIEAALAPIFENDPFAGAASWIESTCDVSITG